MKRLIRVIAKMYPPTWRERYGEEFEALLDDAGADGRIVFDVLCGAVTMQLRQWKKIGPITLLAMSALLAASWSIGQHPYITPGNNLVFRMDSNAGALIGFFGSLIALPAGAVGLCCLLCRISDRSLRGGAARVAKVCAWIVLPYLTAIMLASLLTPRTIVNAGDGYCWDLWCLGVQQVNASPQGRNILYTAEVRLFSDANRVPTSRDKNFLYAIDEAGRRFPVFQNPSALPLDVAIHPAESVTTSLSFLAPANASKLYLAADQMAMPWVYLYLGSDINPLHRRTLLRVR